MNAGDLHYQIFFHSLKKLLKLQKILNRVNQKRKVNLLSLEPAPHFPQPPRQWLGGEKATSPFPERRLLTTPVGHSPATPGRPSRQWLARSPVASGCLQGDSVRFADLCLPASGLLGGHVAPSVLRQVVAAHETPVACRAHKLLLPSVRPAVARELVRAGEFLTTASPAAAKRLLS